MIFNKFYKIISCLAHFSTGFFGFARDLTCSAMIVHSNFHFMRRTPYDHIALYIRSFVNCAKKTGAVFAKKWGGVGALLGRCRKITASIKSKKIFNINTQICSIVQKFSVYSHPRWICIGLRQSNRRRNRGTSATLPQGVGSSYCYNYYFSIRGDDTRIDF